MASKKRGLRVATVVSLLVFFAVFMFIVTSMIQFPQMLQGKGWGVGIFTALVLALVPFCVVWFVYAILRTTILRKKDDE